MRIKEGDKRNDILLASTRIFARAGYHKSKVASIAEEANVATGSVYVYFKNKEDILLQIFEELWKILYNEFKAISLDSSIDSAQKIEQMTELFFEHFTADKDLAKVFVNEQTHLINNQIIQFTRYYYKFLDLGRDIVEEGKLTGSIYNNIDVDIFRHFILGAIRNLLNQWAVEPDKFPLDKIKTNFKSLIKHGILNSK